jgi:hypothetical protein
MRSPRPPKTYVNGQTEESGHFVQARDILVKAGIYRKLGNFGPFFPNKLQRHFSIVETFVKDGFEFNIIESEVISFSLDTLSTSAPHRHREAWYQPVNN